MREAETALKRMALYYLLLAINIIPCAGVIPDAFPIRTSSEVYLLALTVCLILYYVHRVTPTGALSSSIKLLSWMALLLILLRGVKYSAFSEVGVLARHTWYLYYVPMLLIPLLLFYISLLVSPGEKRRISGVWRAALALTVVFIALVLTNDLHQLVFGFRPDYADWDSDYTHGWLFYAVTVWQYALYLAGIVILVLKCRVGSAKRLAWIILFPFAIGMTMNVLLFTDRMPRLNGSHPVEFPEALICTAAVVLECCFQLGLIPTNADYGRMFRLCSISAQITDQGGRAVYSSRSAHPLTREQLALENGARIGAHTVLHRMPLPGGFGFWQDDMTELDRLNDELTEAKEELAQEAELIRLRSELKEKQAKLEQRTLVYDTIARRIHRQSQSISHLARQGRLSSDAAVKEECRRRITLLGAYIKRYANLTLLAQERSGIEAGELALSVSEVLRYLNLCGVPGELLADAEGVAPARAALAVFETFGTLLEANLAELRGVFVNISDKKKSVVVKLTLEHLAAPLSAECAALLSSAGVAVDAQREDGVSYLCLTLPKGGEAA